MQLEMSENVALTTWKHSHCMRLRTSASGAFPRRGKSLPHTLLLLHLDGGWSDKHRPLELGQEMSTFAGSR